MATSNKLSDLREKFRSDSTSWGSLAILTIGIALLVSMMVLYSHGLLVNKVPLY